ncbi:hypothetical protein FUSO6_08975 [Fusobacterium necrophorum DAB]|nr:hypothetical protein FUSO6_08975 [Fusobacterium necrophorum DAB]
MGLSKLGLFSFMRKILRKPINSVRSYYFRKNVEHTFQKILDTLKQENIDFFLVFGTLLGAIREKDFIKHDLDLDFGVWENIDFKLLRKILENNGFLLKSQIKLSNNKSIEYQNYIDIKTKISIDFYKFTRKKAKVLYYDFLREENISYTESIKKNGGLFVYKYEFKKFSLDDYFFKSKKCKIIKEYDEFLEKVYGSNYMTPIKYMDTYLITKEQEYIKNELGKVTYF